MMPRKHRADYILILSMGILLLLGLVVIFSISPILSHKLLNDVNRNFFLYNQLLHISIGLVAFAITAMVPVERWQKWLPWLVGVSGASLLLLLIPGLAVNVNGATRWLDLGIISFQPAELVKFTLVIYLAGWLSKLSGSQTLHSQETLWRIVGILGVVSLFVMFLQKDLGTMLVLASIIIGLYFASGVRMRQIGKLLGMTLAIGVASIVMFPHRIARVLTFLNPDDNITGASYHLNQALIAIGSGGLLGLGLGKSIQVYGYLPEAANDSIFAIIAETFGLIGSMAVFALVGLLVARGLKIANGAPDQNSRLVALGIVLWLGSQAAINIAAMIGIIPLTGIPLPFLSYGGTSLVFTLAAVGLLVNISKYTERGYHADRALGRRDRRPYNAYPGTRTRPQGIR